ncbi:MAG: hypothetical protein QOF20_933 [Acidimicrobiaceae bacterium]|nr:hypothetical protein [Acidimicrobiaceae bacterium]
MLLLGAPVPMLVPVLLVGALALVPVPVPVPVALAVAVAVAERQQTRQEVGALSRRAWPEVAAPLVEPEEAK